MKSNVVDTNKGDSQDQFMNLLNSEDEIERLDASQHSARSRSQMKSKSELDQYNNSKAERNDN